MRVRWRWCLLYVCMLVGHERRPSRAPSIKHGGSARGEWEFSDGESSSAQLVGWSSAIDAPSRAQRGSVPCVALAADLVECRCVL